MKCLTIIKEPLCEYGHNVTKLYFSHAIYYPICLKAHIHILPLYTCGSVLAAQNLNQEAYDSFLDHTFLANRKTTIRSHLESYPDIMAELPPIALTERYGG